MTTFERLKDPSPAPVFRDRRIPILGFLVMLSLLALSAVFYKERALFIDIAYQTFLMIKEGSVQVQVFRFGSAVVQLLPLAAIKLGLPLWVVLFCYSVSFTLFYLLIYLLIVKWLRNEYLAWALVFYFTLIVYDGFYWATSEYQQGIAFMLLVFAFIYRYPKLDRPWHYLFLTPALVAMAYYHPLVFVIFIYVWGYFWLQDHRFHHWRYGLLAGLFLLIVLIKSRISANWYDSNKQNVFLENLIEYFPNYFVFKSHGKFLTNSLEYWYFFPIFLVIMAGTYAYRRSWWKLLWMLGFSFAYIMMLHIGSPNATYRFYAEVNYMPLALVVMIPFLFDVVPLIPKPRLVLFLFALIVTIRLLSIGFHHQPYSDRLEWIKTQQDHGKKEKKGSKLAINRKNVPMDTLTISWGLAFESLLLSSLEHPDSAATLVVMWDQGSVEKAAEDKEHFISEIKRFPLEETNSIYYQLTNEPYQEFLPIPVQTRERY